MKAFMTLLFISPLLIFAQQPDNDIQLRKAVLLNDSLFWAAYNNCQVALMKQYFTDDIEFYHDMGGVTNGLAAVCSSFEQGVCSHRDNFQLRREVVPATIQFYPLRKSGVIYGAVLSGEHLFYVHENGKPERAEGLAKFTHLWVQENNAWKMKRILSYDHRPAPYIKHRAKNF